MIPEVQVRRENIILFPLIKIKFDSQSLLWLDGNHF